MDVRGIGNQIIKEAQYLNPSREDVAVPVPDEAELNEKIDKTAKNDDEQPLSEDDKQKRMQRLQDTLKNHNVEISYNEEVNRYAIKVLDADTKEVVKEIPSEKTLDMFARMLEIEGLLVDEKR